MKKKLLTILLGFVLVFALVGCGDNTNQDDVTQDDVTQDDATQNDVTLEHTTTYDAAMMEDATRVTFQAFVPGGNGEAMLYVLYDDGARASGEVSGTLSIPMTKGSIIYEVLDQYDVVSIEPRLEDYEFEGWLEYRVYPEDPEDPMTHYIQEEVSDKVYTTQEVFDKTVEFDDQVTYYSKWKEVSVQEYEDVLTAYNG